MKEKPWYKKFKLMTTLATVIIELAIAILGTKLTPVYLNLMIYVLAISIALLTGHTVTDVTSILSKSKK